MENLYEISEFESMENGGTVHRALEFVKVSSTFDEKRLAFERAWRSGDYANELLIFSKAIVGSVLRKLYRVSANDTIFRLMCSLDRACNVCDHAIVHPENGTSVSTPDVYTYVLEAAISILESCEKVDTSLDNFTEIKYTVRKLDKRTLIQSADSANFKDKETSVVQSAFSSVRSAIHNDRVIPVLAGTERKKNPSGKPLKPCFSSRKAGLTKFVYLDDTIRDEKTGEEETVYKRYPLYFNAVGEPTDFNGVPLTPTPTPWDYDFTMDTVKLLGLTDREEEVLMLRFRGYGLASIATYLGTTKDSVSGSVRRIRAKAEKVGLFPGMDNDDWGNWFGDNGLI